MAWTGRKGDFAVVVRNGLPRHGCPFLAMACL
jgi:hypothetical protein